MDFEISKVGSGNEPDSRSNYEVFAAATGILRVTEHHRITRPRLKYGAAGFMLIRSRNTRANVRSVALRISAKDQKGLERVMHFGGRPAKSLDFSENSGVGSLAISTVLMDASLEQKHRKNRAFLMHGCQSS